MDTPVESCSKARSIFFYWLTSMGGGREKPIGAQEICDQTSLLVETPELAEWFGLELCRIAAEEYKRAR